MAKKLTNALLWEISHPKLKEKSYLFGTMHVKDDRAFNIIDIVFKKIEKCQALATEFNIEEADFSMPSNALDLPESGALTDYISTKEYNKLRKETLKHIGFDIEMVKNALPLVISNSIALHLFSSDNDKSLDETLVKFAYEKEIPTLGIETFQEQIDILKKIPLSFQIKALLDIGKNFTKFKKQNKKVAKLYEKGDINQLYQHTKKSTGKMRKVLIFNRNEIMAERITKIVKEQSTFCAIGAGHLAGKKGVLRLLKQNGFKLKPIFK